MKGVMEVQVIDQDSQAQLKGGAAQDFDAQVVFKAEMKYSKDKFQAYGRLSSAKATIVCVPPEMEFNYAVANTVVGRISLQQFYAYEEKYFALGWEKFLAPDILVYIKADQKISGEKPEAFMVVNRAWLAGIDRRLKVVEVERELLEKEKGAETVAALIWKTWQALPVAYNNLKE